MFQETSSGQPVDYPVAVSVTANVTICSKQVGCQLPAPTSPKTIYTASIGSTPKIQLADGAAASVGTLTWNLTGGSAFGGYSFVSPTTAAPPHSNELDLKVGQTVAPGDYSLFVSVSANGQTGPATQITLRVLPPLLYDTSANQNGVFEMDNSGQVVDGDGTPVLESDSTTKRPDFGVTYTTTSSASARTETIVNRGYFDPFNPSARIRADIRRIQARELAGCVSVVAYDNLLHNNEAGTQDATGTYQIYAYCTLTLSYIFKWARVAWGVNTTLPGSILNGTIQFKQHTAICALSPDEVDGMTLCRIQDSPVVLSPPLTNASEHELIAVTDFGVGETQFDVALDLNTISNLLPQVVINWKGVLYPKVNARRWGYPEVYVPFPNPADTAEDGATFHYCANRGSQFDPGCVARRGASGVLAANITYKPIGNVQFTAHHIQPVCWGGNNSNANGVFLPTTSTQHRAFTDWWSTDNFTPDGIKYPVSDTGCGT